MKILPGSIENVGGFIFNYRVKNAPCEFSLHRLMLDVKDKALKAELSDVFEKCPPKHNEDSLKIDFTALDKSGGTIMVNDKWIKLLRFGDFDARDDKNLTVIRKLVELSKAIAKAPFEFKNNLSEMKESVKAYNFYPTGVSLAEYEQEPGVLKRFADEVTIENSYDPRNAKYVSNQMEKMIHKDVLHYFDVL